MSTTNPITGDLMVSRTFTKEGAESYDRIFKKCPACEHSHQNLDALVCTLKMQTVKRNHGCKSFVYEPGTDHD